MRFYPSDRRPLRYIDYFSVGCSTFGFLTVCLFSFAFYKLFSLTVWIPLSMIALAASIVVLQYVPLRTLKFEEGKRKRRKEVKNLRRLLEQVRNTQGDHQLRLHALTLIEPHLDHVNGNAIGQVSSALLAGNSYFRGDLSIPLQEHIRRLNSLLSTYGGHWGDDITPDRPRMYYHQYVTATILDALIDILSEDIDDGVYRACLKFQDHVRDWWLGVGLDGVYGQAEQQAAHMYAIQQEDAERTRQMTLARQWLEQSESSSSSHQFDS